MDKLQVSAGEIFFSKYPPIIMDDQLPSLGKSVEVENGENTSVGVITDISDGYINIFFSYGHNASYVESRVEYIPNRSNKANKFIIRNKKKLEQ